MIRIEIEVTESTPGKVDVLCRSVSSNWVDPTWAEKRVADRMVGELRYTCADVAGMFGSVETFEGKEVRGVRR